MLLHFASSQRGVKAHLWEWNLLKLRRMTLELVSEVNGRKYHIQTKTLGKLLHIARLQGWRVDFMSHESTADSGETAIVLPHVETCMPRRVSRADAEVSRKVLTKALATGTVAAEGTVQVAAETLLQVARQGAFRVCVGKADPVEQHSPIAAFPA